MQKYVINAREHTKIILSSIHNDVEVTALDSAHADVVIDVGSGIDLRCTLHCKGRGSRIVLRCVGKINGEQRVRLHVTQLHSAKASISDVQIRLAALEQAKCDVQGRIIVQRGAVQTEALFSATALALGDGQSIVSQPELEVLNDDVQCRHATSICGIDDKQKLYTLARGIGPVAAQALLVDAFLDKDFR
jgi:Fe-S cluster assembly scaffold protein SufB